MSDQCVFVVGVDSAIGGALFRKLRRERHPVVGSTRRTSRADDLVHLDLSHVDDAKLPPSIGATVIAAGITSLAACRENPDRTRAINVVAALRLAEKAAKQGSFVTVLSTNLVFDGTRPRPSSHDAPRPQSEYGSQKIDLERGILDLGHSAAVVRLTKVVSPETKLLREWRDTLGEGRPIHPFTGMVMAPIPLTRVVDVLAVVAQRRISGLFQISATADISYVDAAAQIADIAHVSRALVEPRPPPDDLPIGERPRHTSLDTIAAETELNWRPISPEEALHEMWRP